MKSKIIFGKMVDYFRKENSMTMEDLGQAMNKSKSSISRWVSGERYPKIEEVEKLAKIFNTDVETILFGASGDGAIMTIYNELHPPRQQKVYDFATQQLEEQNNIIQLDQVKEVDYKEVALFGGASAGTGQQVFNNPIEWVSVPADIVPDNYDVALKVVGDSMEPAFEDGEYIFINQTQDVRSGQFVVVIVDDEAYLKKIYISDDSVRLVSLNKYYDDIVVDSTSELNIVGTVVL